MIIVKIWGGIGNQLFQYVFGQYLHYRYGQEVFYDDNAYISVDKLRNRELDSLDRVIKYDNSCNFSKYRGVKNRLLRFLWQTSPRKHLVLEGKTMPKSFLPNHIYFFQGYWQDIKYYKWLMENVLDFDLQSKHIPEELVCLYDEVRNEENSVSIHVRRGDYFSPKNIKTYGVCDIDYFNSALEKISMQIPNFRLFVFSDDLDWVRENLRVGDNAIFVPNYSISQFAYIELMSHCRHHIISNSSFSWWGAVLNSQDSSMVIAPKSWTLTSVKTIALETWFKI